MKKLTAVVRLVNWALAMGGTTLVAIGIWRFVQGDVAGGSAAATLGLFFMLSATIDRFEFLKGFGIEAKLHELKDAIEEADETLERIRKLTEVTGSQLVSVMARAGRWDSGTPPDEAYRTAKGLRAVLTDAGSDATVVRNALMPWAMYLALDVGRDLLYDYGKSLKGVQSQRQEIVSRWPSPIRLPDPAWDKAHSDLQEVSAYAGSLIKGVSARDPAETVRHLRQLVLDAPRFVASEALEELKRDVELWAPELEYLSVNLDLRDPAMWFARLDLKDSRQS